MSRKKASGKQMRSPSEYDQLIELEHIYQTAPIGLCLLDRDLRYVRINDRLAAMNGRAVSDHIGRTLREVIPEIAPKLEPICREVIESGKPVLNLEVHGMTPAQPVVEKDWLVSFHPLKSADGQVIGISTVVQDISDRKKTEERLKESEERFGISGNKSLGNQRTRARRNVYRQRSQRQDSMGHEQNIKAGGDCAQRF